MYSNVPPPSECTNGNVLDAREGSSSREELNVDKQKDRRSAGVENLSKTKNERWQRFQRLKERRKETCDQFQELKKEKPKKTGAKKDPKLEPERQAQSKVFEENKGAWKELCQNFHANAHLSETVTAKGKPKGKLEEDLEKAIEEGDFSKAECLSDEIAQQDLSVKIVGAIKVRDYKKRKEMEEQCQKAKKKKKLIWGFEQKERWESKGNM